MAAPSSTPRDHHLVWDPHKQTATTQSKDNASFKRIQHKTSEKLRSHVSKRRLASCLTLLILFHHSRTRTGCITKQNKQITKAKINQSAVLIDKEAPTTSSTIILRLLHPVRLPCT